MDKRYNILFLCTGNSARSIMAEALLNHLGQGRFQAYSAGSRPAGAVNPHALATLSRYDIPFHAPRSKSWEEFAAPGSPPMDFVITVCANAAGETCPAYLGPVVRAHWGVDDPAHATGTDEEIEAAFTNAYRILRHRIEAFIALPLAQLKHDRAQLKVELDRIGTLSE